MMDSMNLLEWVNLFRQFSVQSKEELRDGEVSSGVSHGVVRGRETGVRKTPSPGSLDILLPP